MKSYTIIEGVGTRTGIKGQISETNETFTEKRTHFFFAQELGKHLIESETFTNFDTRVQWLK